MVPTRLPAVPFRDGRCYRAVGIWERRVLSKIAVLHPWRNWGGWFKGEREEEAVSTEMMGGF